MHRHGVVAQTSCVLRDGAARLLRMRYSVDGIEKNLILRKPRSGCLEGRTLLVPATYQRFTPPQAASKHARPRCRTTPGLQVASLCSSACAAAGARTFAPLMK